MSGDHTDQWTPETLFKVTLTNGHQQHCSATLIKGHTNYWITTILFKGHTNQ